MNFVKNWMVSNDRKSIKRIPMDTFKYFHMYNKHGDKYDRQKRILGK